MKFFKDLREDIAGKVEDLTSVEHAFIERSGDTSRVILYRKQELDGDSVIYQADENLSPELLQAFNKAFEASIIARTGVLKGIMKIFS